ncbi:MAG: hypothetical protein Q4G24_05775 [Paracoccus sp. (in: a-proteobacteria)]|uniref:hypothetical protein n=1 Tax=Paracoccus sp. TaxID=267 RepID=UPI0026DF27D1|nr:hypothetical protein [Paracoccus sp. (in: a-proteobacteria)]MDO5620962.1 hypothetical protein [Paracoccus sp. (in: a-proteobacteria)]
MTLEAARAALRLRQGAGARYDAPEAPAQALTDARRGMAYFARKLNDLPDAALWDASARPGWSRRRVIAGAALQARDIAQRLEDATGQQGDREDTGPAALDLAETLPARALRHLAAHADIHLNVVWRDLTGADWPLAAATPHARAVAIWAAALALRNGGRLADVPQPLREAVHARITEQPDLA